jgi:DNA-binding NarL/FixJ family response regulator
LLELEPEFRVAGDFPSCENAFSLAQSLQPDVVVMDIDMPGVDGIEGTRRIKSAKPNTEVIMHTVFEDDERLFAAFCAGASGYLLKTHSPLRLPDAIREAMQGGLPASPGIARRILRFLQQNTERTDYGLTARETEVLGWLVKGYSYKMIADACFLSIETIKSHLKNVYVKLHVSCATEAVAKALKERIVV